jgi:hypothetical protein
MPRDTPATYALHRTGARRFLGPTGPGRMSSLGRAPDRLLNWRLVEQSSVGLSDRSDVDAVRFSESHRRQPLGRHFAQCGIEHAMPLLVPGHRRRHIWTAFIMTRSTSAASWWPGHRTTRPDGVEEARARSRAGRSVPEKAEQRVGAGDCTGPLTVVGARSSAVEAYRDCHTSGRARKAGRGRHPAVVSGGPASRGLADAG